MRVEKLQYTNLLGAPSDSYTFFTKDDEKLGVITMNRTKIFDMDYWDLSIFAPGHGREVLDYWYQHLSKPYKSVGVWATPITAKAESFFSKLDIFEKNNEYETYVLKWS